VAPENALIFSEKTSLHTTIPETEVAKMLADLRRQMAALYTLQDLPLPVLGVAGTGQPYIITLPADPNAPLDQLAVRLEGGDDSAMLLERARPAAEGGSREDMAGEQARATVAAGIHMPYWGLLWASGQALAETVLADQESLRGRRGLELGCGLGLVAAAALAAGTQLWVADCFSEALLFTRFNGLHLTGRMPETLLLDWRTLVGQEACRAVGPFDVLLAADVLYEEEDLAPLLKLIPSLLAPGGTFLLAEPGRRVSRAFLAAAQERGWKSGRTLIYHRSWPPDDEVVQVTVHTLTLP
jgi:predicted nicotinamide N-methyase